MKTVFSGDMLFHVWAQNSQSEGRRTDGRVFFDGPTLYSYGRHFALGHVMPDGATLLNADSYSISTSQHQRQTKSAAREGRTYRVPALTDLVHSYQFRTDPTAARDSIVRHVTQHALAMPDESAVYLLTLAKRPRAWPSIKAAAERAKAKAAKAAKAREIASRKADAERMAGMSDAAFSDLMAAREGAKNWGKFPTDRDWPRTEYRNARPSENVAELATELHRLNVSAKAHCGKRIQATIAARLKAARTRARSLAKWESHGDALAQWGRVKEAGRTLYRQRMETGPLSRDANKRLGAIAQWFLDHARARLIGPDGRAMLESIVANCATLESEAAARETAERMERERAAREAWLAGGGERWTRFSDAQGGAMLRARGVERDESGAIVAGTLETSHGADCPLPHALKAFAFVRRVVATGQAWHANGHTIRVGHFRVDSIAPDGTMRAGCHTIHLAEMERLAAALDVADLPPSDSALELTKGAA